MTVGCAIAFDSITLTLKPHFWSTPRTLLSSISFSIAQGQSCALLGANGAGKTTLLRILLGLFRPTRGTGMLDAAPLGSPQSRRRLGFLPERPALPLDLTPDEFVTFSARQSGLPKHKAKEAAQTALARLGMTAHKDRRMRAFSKGMLQRVGLAQAVAHEPHVLVLDEPLSGLDPPARRDVRQLLQQERARGAAILFSTHILSDVISTCDKAAVLVNGQLAHFDAPFALLQKANEAEGEPAQVEVIARGLSVEAAETLAHKHHATLAKDYEHELRFLVAGLAHANQLLGTLHAQKATVLSVEQDTRLLERLLQGKAAAENLS